MARTRGNFRPFPTGTTLRVESGVLIESGTRVQLETWVDDGEYWVVEDLGRLITLQPKQGGEHVAARKADL